MTKENRSPWRARALLAASSSLISLTLLGAAHPAHAAILTKPFGATGPGPSSPAGATLAEGSPGPTICDLNVTPGCSDPCVVPSPSTLGDPGCTGVSPSNGKILTTEDILRFQLVDALHANAPIPFVAADVGDYELIEEGCANAAVPDPLAGGALNPCVSDLVRFVNVVNGGVTQGEIWFLSDSANPADVALVPALPGGANVFGFQQETAPATAAGNTARIYRNVVLRGVTWRVRTNITSDMTSVAILSDTIGVFVEVPALSPVSVIALAILLLAIGGAFMVRRGKYRID